MCAYQVFQWLSVPYLFAGYYTVITLRYVFFVELCCCPYHCDFCFRPAGLVSRGATKIAPPQAISGMIPRFLPDHYLM